MTTARSRMQHACAQAASALRAGEPYTALSLYAHAIAMIEPFTASDCEVPEDATAAGRQWARRLLILGAVADKTSQPADLADLTLAGPDDFRGQICLVVGTTGAGIAMPEAEALLGDGFAAFSGTVISGGTTQGVAGLVAGLGEHDEQRLRTIGYAPRNAEEIDRRYHRLLFTDGPDFSPWEALQAWTDLLAAGVDPRSVTVLGLGGGRISAAEYRIALALGACVGVVQRLGRAGIELLDDPLWSRHPRLQCLPWEPAAVAGFLAGDVATPDPIQT